MSILHGRDLLIKTEYDASHDYTTVACAKSCEINVQASTIETSSPSSGSWRTYIVGRKDWSLSINHLVVEGTLSTNALRVGQSVTIKFHERDTGAVMRGTAIITKWRVTATVGNLATGGFQLRGNGPLTAVS